MNNLEKKMVNTLIDLRENHHVIGVKAEFEAEGTRMEEALRLKDVAARAGLDITIKIGGCEAIKDMYDARIIGVSGIVAPMIETPYAMQKYIQALKFVFPEEERQDIKFLINIETVTGFNNLDDITASPYFSELAGIVLGRVDMTGSMGMSKEDINSEIIFNITNTAAMKMRQLNKELVVGGNVCANSLDFFRKLPEQSLTRFETRKIIFDAQTAVSDPDTEKGILKAIGFEIMWIKNKQEFYKMRLKEDTQRLAELETRYKKLIESEGGIYA